MNNQRSAVDWAEYNKSQQSTLNMLGFAALTANLQTLADMVLAVKALGDKLRNSLDVKR